MRNRIGIAIIIIITFFLVGCMEESNTPSIVQDGAEHESEMGQQEDKPIEELGKSDQDQKKITIEGRLIVKDPLMFAPDPNDAIYLVPLDSQENINTIPKFQIGEVPQAIVDERNGDFIFTNIDPGTYAIMVLTMDGKQIPARFYNQGHLAIITLDQEDLGKVIEVELLAIP